MKRFELAQRAHRDIQDIWEYICEDSFDAADRVLEDLFGACARLAESPGIGHRRPDLTTREVLFWTVRSYLIVYRDTNPLRIVRVVHGKRDVKRLLKKH